LDTKERRGPKVPGTKKARLLHFKWPISNDYIDLGEDIKTNDRLEAFGSRGRMRKNSNSRDSPLLIMRAEGYEDDAKETESFYEAYENSMHALPVVETYKAA
jgi:hypothetical protein